MQQENLEKIVKYLRTVGLSEEQIIKQLANKALVESYLSQGDAYDKAIQEYENIAASGNESKKTSARGR